MIFNIKKHSSPLYSILLKLSRNINFYQKIHLKDSFETRIYLMFIHFSIILIIFKKKEKIFPQSSYDDLFFNIENDLREMGLGDVGVNKKMKDLNKIFYDILLKLNSSKKEFEINKKLIFKYFIELNDKELNNYRFFDQYCINFYHFCFELPPETMIKDALKFIDL